MTPQLLVSVRSATEAEEALAGGADLIDVKEPALGSLGRASDAVVAAIVKRVAGRVPTSAALGELRDWDGIMPDGVDFVKAGLAGLAGTDWRARLDAFRDAAAGRAVIVAYADEAAARAPLMNDVVVYAERWGQVLLVDTYSKSGSTLFDFITPASLSDAIAVMHASRRRVALAGSLTAAAAKRVATLGPDWIAVRSAVCIGGRSGTVCRHKVSDFRRAERRKPSDAPHE